MPLIAPETSRCTYHPSLQRNHIIRLPVKPDFRNVAVATRRSVVAQIAIFFRITDINHILKPYGFLFNHKQSISCPESRIIAAFEYPAHHTVDEWFNKQVELMKNRNPFLPLSVTEISEITQFLMSPKRNSHGHQLFITVRGQAKNSVSIDIFKTYLSIPILTDGYRNPLHV